MLITKLKVWPNPFLQIDHEGRPNGVLPYEPEGDGVRTFDSRRFVGAHLKAVILEEFPKGDPRQTVQDTTFEYEEVAVEVKNTPYYRNALKDGSLFAADEKTARLAGIKFVDPDKALTNAKTAALEVWSKTYKHEETDYENGPQNLIDFSFGPMQEFIDRKKHAEQEAKKAEAKKAEEDKKAADEKKRQEEEAKKEADLAAKKAEAAAKEAEAKIKAEQDADAKKALENQNVGKRGKAGE